jgi:hypothetical protein
MGCLICGKPMVSEGTLEQITNIKAKKAKIEEKTTSVFTSDPNLALNLIIKSKKYDKEIKHLEKGSFATRQLLCDKCYKKVIRSVRRNTTRKGKESEYSKSKEILRVFKIYSFMLKKVLQDLYYNIDHPINKKIPESYSEDTKDFLNNLSTKFYDTADNIQKNIFNCEYYEAKLFYILGYYNDALLRFQNVLDELEQIDDNKDMKGYLTEEKLEDYIRGRNERKNEIKEIIYEIKEKLRQD